MKKLILMLCLAFALCLISGCKDTSPGADYDSPNIGGARDTSVFYKKPTHSSHYSTMVFNTLFARSFLLHEGVLEGTGFEENNNDFGVGAPYSVFAFDRQGQLIEEEIQMICPLKSKNTYIGKAVFGYDATFVRHDGTLGKNTVAIYKEDLPSQLENGTVDTRKILTLGKVGSKTFVTDGVNLDILAVDDSPHPDDMTDDELKALAATFKAAAGETYSYVCGYYITVQPIEQ